MIFKKIRYQNLLSTGNQWTEIDLNKNSTTLIIGGNGSGKSTVLDALSFVLFVSQTSILVIFSVVFGIGKVDIASS